MALNMSIIAFFVVHFSGNFSASFLHTLKKAEEDLGEKDLQRQEIFLLFFAATETTGTTMAGCILILAMHPDIQDKVYEEIYQVFSDSEKIPEISEIDQLHYLDQVLQETQRIFTLVPIIIRHVENDTKIGEHIYPAGTSIAINITGIHHDPKIYPNPYRFNPDNFANENVKNRSRYSFLPFSAGNRNCLGKIFADLVMKLQLIALLRTFEFRTTKKMEDLKLKPGFIERIASGYPVSIKLRKKSLLQ